MDFMDPGRRLRHNVLLAAGYILIAIALLLLTAILLFVAYGFGLQNGKVIQSGLLFVSSSPNPAQIYINGERNSNNTNTKLVLPEGTYNFVLKRPGYRDWQRAITVDGGTVESYAYPWLFPTSLTTNTTHTYAAAPAIAAESPDRHWLLVSQPGAFGSFDLYDLTDMTKQPIVVAFPNGILAASSGTQNLQLVAWADDNDHILLKHTYDTNTEYVLLKRSSSADSVNVTKALNLPLVNTDVRFRNNKFDQYMVWDTLTHQLSRASLGTPALQPYLKGVLAFASYSDNTVLYVMPDPTEPSKVDTALYDGSKSYTIRQSTASSTYLLDVASYSGDVYVAISASSDGTAFVYKNPVDQITSSQLGAAVPVQVFRIKNPSYVSFSTTAQYVLFESGTQIATYDAENQQGFNFTEPDTLDTPQTHANWMDGAHLDLISKGQIVAMDYDGQNRQVLVSADPRYDLTFDQQYKVMYAFVPSAADKNQELLTRTSLRTPADQ